jgi:hypothetical protein
MATKVNYEDNLFYLISLTKAIGNGVQLELDRDYFRDKVVEDLLFIDRTLQQIYDSLSTNTFLINRKGHLRELMRAKRAYADMLDDVVNQKGQFARELEQFAAKFSGARDQHIRDIADIQGLMEAGRKEEHTEDIVSQDEYRFLFQNDENDE